MVATTDDRIKRLADETGKLTLSFTELSVLYSRHYSLDTDWSNALESIVADAPTNRRRVVTDFLNEVEYEATEDAPARLDDSL